MRENEKDFHFSISFRIFFCVLIFFFTSFAITTKLKLKRKRRSEVHWENFPFFFIFHEIFSCFFFCYCDRETIETLKLSTKISIHFVLLANFFNWENLKNLNTIEFTMLCDDVEDEFKRELELQWSEMKTFW